jgi:putative ABC transport system permease protein
LGWDEPIGKRIEWLFWKRKGQVIGVVKDFHVRSLHEKIPPVAICMWTPKYNLLSLRIQAENIPGTMAFLEKKWRQFIPDRPFEAWFMDEGIDRLYRSEAKFGQIFRTFSMLAIFIACLGLFGLAAYTAEQRTKEIGIRKVLGASVSGIVLLFSKDFVKLVALANLIAWPVAYYAASRWLQGFAYRINLGIGVFVLGGALALVIALLTVSAQAIRAARANPVDALRYE